MPVDSPEYIARQRGDQGGSSLLWFFITVIAVFVIGGTMYLHYSKGSPTTTTAIVSQ